MALEKREFPVHVLYGWNIYQHENTIKHSDVGTYNMQIQKMYYLYIYGLNGHYNIAKNKICNRNIDIHEFPRVYTVASCVIKHGFLVDGFPTEYHGDSVFYVFRCANKFGIIHLPYMVCMSTCFGRTMLEVGEFQLGSLDLLILGQM